MAGSLRLWPLAWAAVLLAAVAFLGAPSFSGAHETSAAAAAAGSQSRGGPTARTLVGDPSFAPLPAMNRSDDGDGSGVSAAPDDDDENSPANTFHDHITIVSNNNALHKKEYVTHEQTDPGYLEHQTEHYEQLFHEQMVRGELEKKAAAQDDTREKKTVLSQLQQMQAMVREQGAQIRHNQQVIELNAQRAAVIRQSQLDNDLEQQRQSQSQSEHDQRLQLGELQQHQQNLANVVGQQLEVVRQHERQVQEQHLAHVASETHLSNLLKQKQQQQAQALHASQTQWQTHNMNHMLNTYRRDSADAQRTLEDEPLYKRGHDEHPDFPSPVVPPPSGPLSMAPPVVTPDSHGSSSDSTGEDVVGFNLPNSGMFSSDVWEHEPVQPYNWQTPQQANKFHADHLKHLEDVRQLNEVYRDVVRKHVVKNDVNNVAKNQVRMEHQANVGTLVRAWNPVMQDKMNLLKDDANKIDSRVHSEQVRLVHMQKKQEAQQEAAIQKLASLKKKAAGAMAGAINALQAAKDAAAAKAEALAKAAAGKKEF